MRLSRREEAAEGDIICARVLGRQGALQRVSRTLPG
jgi:hypothetical protein